MFTEADRRVLGIAARQDGVVTRAQALAAGLSSRQIDRRLSSGAWPRLASGIYRLGPVPAGPRQRLRAVLLTLPGAVVSHETAAELLGIGPVPPGRIVVTVREPAHQVSPVARVHRTRNLAATDVLRIDGLTVTTRCRTIVDVAGCLPPSDLGRLVDNQLAARLIRLPELRATFRRVGRFRLSAGVMREVLNERSPGFVAPESVLEEAFLALVERHGLPPPVRQFAVPWLAPERGRVDFAYPDARVAVEVDGRRWHTRDAAARRDRWRDRQAQLAGWLVLRYGSEELAWGGKEVAHELRQALLRIGAVSPAA